ncbi:MAG: protein glxC, partial [Betaproteobacteria bacterium]|nr:protein glxC [Betaproteobacteria bacterium]
MEGMNFDLRQQTVRELNGFLHSAEGKAKRGTIAVHHPDGAHNIAAGLNAPVKVVVHGHAGYYAAG